MDDNSDTDKPISENSLVKGSFIFTDIAGISEYGKLAKDVLMRFCNGIGIAYDDVFAKKHAKDKANEIEAVGKAHVNVDVYRQEQLMTLEGRAVARVEYHQVRQQENLEAIARHAAGHANMIENKSPKTEQDAPEWGPKNDDWLAEFIDISKNTSEEHMQEIWGRVLAQEVKKPNSFSVQALMTLKTMPPTAAKIFEKICSLNVQPFGLVKTEQHAFTNKVSFGVSYSEVIIAREYGLLTNGDHTHTSMGAGGALVFTYFDRSHVMFNNTNGELKVEEILLTEVGKELSSIPEVQRNDAYFLAVIEYLTKQGFEKMPSHLNAPEIPITP